MVKQPSAPGRSVSRPVGFIRDLPIWTKLGLIMIVPTIATIVVGTIALLGQVAQASDADRARTLTVLSGDASALVDALQAERVAAVQLLLTPNEQAPMEAARGAYSAHQQDTQGALDRYLATRATIADLPAGLRHALDDIASQLGQLTQLRQQVVAVNQVSLNIAVDRYSVIITNLLDIRELSAQLTGNASLTDRIRAADAVALQKEYLAQAQVIVLESLAAGGPFSAAARASYDAAHRNADQAADNFRAIATSAEIDHYERTISGDSLRQALLAEGKLDALLPEQPPTSAFGIDEWDQAMNGRTRLIYQVEVDLNNEALSDARTLGSQVQRRVLIETGALLLTLLVGVLFAWLVARSMARSLRDLRQGALAVAQYGLPQAVARLRDPAVSANLSPAGVALQIAEPLPVRSNDEFGQVTEAFNAVHLEAVRTAAEQAALRASVATMFVNLARRSQILVDRLIGHLDRLERGEEDPDRLSELFQLDHLATRMRRNDENLLVLAGADSTRIQREPAALGDVLRAAQSEVEQYTRVEFSNVDQDIEIAAHAVNDLVHLVAELFDNATSFSPPDSAIRVEARRVGEQAVLRVEDRGIGMTYEQYAELNERLAQPPQVDVAVSRMMGLVVVARLGARHGVTVTLQPAPQRGTIADVMLPAGVLVPRAFGGRALPPSGFPAVRPGDPTPVAGQRSPFGPPLALDAAPAGGWDTGWEAGHGSQAPYGAPPAFSPPSPGYGAPTPTYGAPAPSYGGQPGYAAQPGYGAQPGPGYGAPAPAYGATPTLAGGLGAALTSAGAIPPVRGGQTPSWYDLTGAGPNGGPGNGSHGTATMPGGPGGPGGFEPLPQRRPGGWGDDGASAAQAGWGEPAPSYGGGGYGSPAPSMPSSAPPSAWPPAAGGQPYVAVPGPAGANDMTVELPIFSELESAWFSTGGGPSETPQTGAQPGAWPPDATSSDVSWRSVADDGWRAAAAAAAPQDQGTTDNGLPRRVPMAQLVPGGVETPAASAGADRRTPDSVRGLLSAYHRGVQRGRDAHGGADDEYSSGKEQEA